MKLLKELAAFAVEEFSVALLVGCLVFSLWASNKMLSDAFVTAYAAWILRSLAIIGLVLNGLMIAVALKIMYDDFRDWRAARREADND